MVCCEEVRECLQSVHPNTQNISPPKMKIVCQSEKCHGQQQIHYLNESSPYKQEIGGRVLISAVCKKNEKLIRDMTLEELYWFEEFESKIERYQFKTKSCFSLYIFIRCC